MRHFLIGLLALSPVFALGQDSEDTRAGGPIVICPIEGDVEPGMAVLVNRGVKEANAMGAQVIVFRVDTFGGRVDSAVEIADHISKADCRTIAFIEGKGAISAGALISFGCDDIIMAPGTNIGAATPVYFTSEGVEVAGEKSVSFMRAKMRALAEANGHNPDIAQAMVDTDIELRAKEDENGKLIVYAPGVVGDGTTEQPKKTQRQKSPIEEIIDNLGGAPEDTDEAPEVAAPEPETKPGTVIFEDGSRLILPKGKLLTLTPEESLEYGVITATARTVADVLEYYDLPEGELYTVESNWAEDVYKFLTNPTIAGLLLMLGLGGLYFEVKTPGFGVPGIIGVSSLLLLFGAHYVLGLTEVIDVVLLVSGLILILIEVFVLPGFGVAGVTGLICVVLGTYLALVDFTFPQYTWEFDRLEEVVYSLMVASVSFSVLVFLSWKYLPRTPFFNAFILTEVQRPSEGYVVQTQADIDAALGLEGVATSMLRPTGRGRFGDKTYQVVARGDFIEKGTPIKIVQAEGNRYVVDVPPPKEGG